MKKILLLLLPWLTLAVPMKAWMSSRDFYVGDLSYQVIQAADENTHGTVAVGLYYNGSQTATSSVSSVTIPATVTVDGSLAGTYDVVKIADYGFTAGSGGNTKVIDLQYVNGTSGTQITLPCSSTGFAGGTNDPYDTFDAKTTTINGVTYTIRTAYDKSTYGNSYRNDALTSVEIANDCPLKEIGNFAFAGCVNLKSFRVPATVETLGIQAFGACISLEEFSFGTDASGRTKITTIPIFCFSGCVSLTQIVIPEGVTTIQERAFQYNLSLVSINLPNSLVVIGAHFVCDAQSLKSITIPPNVKYIDEALFHGCCSLKDVYLLGDPADLQAGDGTSNTTFSHNRKFGGDGPSGCTIHVYPKYLPAAYQETGICSNSGTTKPSQTANTYLSGAWYHFLDICPENTSYTSTTIYTCWGNGNCYMPMLEKTREVPNKWVTATMYKAMTKSQVISTFGADTKVAYMTSAVWNEDESQPNTIWNDRINMYDLTFTVVKMSELSNDDIVIHANMPFMLKPSNENETSKFPVYDGGVMEAGYSTGDSGTYTDGFGQTQNYQTWGTAEDISSEHAVAVPAQGTVGFNAVIVMLSKYTEYRTQKWECVFKNPGTYNSETGTYGAPYDLSTNMGFYRSPSNNYQYLDMGRCWWHINETLTNSEGQSANNYQSVKATMVYDVEEDQNATGIDELHVKVATFDADKVNEVYSITGQKVNPDNMSKGFYIVNGKKIYVK